MPEATIEATADHGEFADDSVTANYADAQDVLDRMERVGVAYDDVVKVVEAEGVDKFEKAGQEMIDTVSAALEQAKK
jgi:transaldolase